MKPNPEAAILHKCRELIMQLNVNLNHFPRHEKHGLCLQIRNLAYGVLKGLVECEKRYHNKTSLTRLDVEHEQLRTLVNLSFEMGYFGYHHHKSTRSDAESLRRYTAVSILLNELGAMIGGWIRSLRVIPQAE
jgi:hypothetical protein